MVCSSAIPADSTVVFPSSEVQCVAAWPKRGVKFRLRPAFKSNICLDSIWNDTRLAGTPTDCAPKRGPALTTAQHEQSSVQPSALRRKVTSDPVRSASSTWGQLVWTARQRAYGNIGEDGVRDRSSATRECTADDILGMSVPPSRILSIPQDHPFSSIAY